MEKNSEIIDLGNRHDIKLSKFFLKARPEFTEQIKNLYYENERTRIINRLTVSEKKEELESHKKEIISILAEIKGRENTLEEKSTRLEEKLIFKLTGTNKKDFIWIYEYYNNTLLLEQIRNKELILSQMEREKEAKLREVELKLMLNKSHEVIAEAQSDIQGLKRRINVLEKKLRGKQDKNNIINID